MTHVFHNPHSQEIVHLRTGVIQFEPTGRDEQGRAMGVFRTDDEAVAAALNDAIARGYTPARYVDEEEAEAMAILGKRRQKTGERLAAANRARAEKAGD